MTLFDMIFGRAIERRISEYQNDLIAKHYDEVQNIYRQMRGWRHDYHNHIQVMRVLVSQARNAGENHDDEAALYNERLDKYLTELNNDLSAVDTVIKTGNVMIDAILNSKLSLIKSKNININAKAVVPSELKTSEIDLCVIIGNLLDNAMEACLKQSETKDRFIRIYIGILKEQLYIYVSNSVGGEVKNAGMTYVSTKCSDTHGFGLIRVDRIVDKYNGYVNRQNEDGVFATEVMLPL
ncbi:hypothetical protein SDC9_134463 [bioreactor metagenome]|uniref:Sensor histidine kinase NatK-like C-terminal domain-containing protein n=1 Tax=bioreactor metagenome TaxID=1076179 RepID=A0A645DDQ0_9ZZZZ